MRYSSRAPSMSAFLLTIINYTKYQLLARKKATDTCSTNIIRHQVSLAVDTPHHVMHPCAQKAELNSNANLHVVSNQT
jgi:hypothetical protein